MSGELLIIAIIFLLIGIILGISQYKSGYTETFVNAPITTHLVNENRKIAETIGDVVTNLTDVHVNLPEKPDTSCEPCPSCTPCPQPQQTTKIGCTSDDDCNLIYGRGLNKCLVNNQCDCVEGSGTFCHYGPTYYKDPKNMSTEQIRRFKYYAKLYKMTLQDYINWLYLFVNDQHQLAPHNLTNLKKLLKGIKLTLDDVPRENVPIPLTAQEYFEKMYQIDDQLAMPNLNTAGIQLPYNIDSYNSFEPPMTLKHLNDDDSDLKLHKYQYKDAIIQTRPVISHDWIN